MSKTQATQTKTPQSPNVEVETVEAGKLVFEAAELPGKKLIGFAGIKDREAMADELRKRGLGTGAIRNKPIFNEAAL